MVFLIILGIVRLLANSDINFYCAVTSMAIRLGPQLFPWLFRPQPRYDRRTSPMSQSLKNTLENIKGKLNTISTDNQTPGPLKSSIHLALTQAPNEASGHLANVLQSHAEPEQQAILRGLILQKPTLARTCYQAQALLPRFDQAVTRRGRIEKKKTEDIT
ncbi:hypothetical protein LRP88_12670 [Fusarium phalaenopsidis]|nr:hypothetical protein NCS56_01538100 [Fusarium sp. Ph1]